MANIAKFSAVAMLLVLGMRSAHGDVPTYQGTDVVMTSLKIGQSEWSEDTLRQIDAALRRDAIGQRETIAASLPTLFWIASIALGVSAMALTTAVVGFVCMTRRLQELQRAGTDTAT